MTESLQSDARKGVWVSQSGYDGLGPNQRRSAEDARLVPAGTTITGPGAAEGVIIYLPDGPVGLTESFQGQLIPSLGSFQAVASEIFDPAALEMQTPPQVQSIIES